MLKLFKDIGLYFPSFFFIKLNTEEPLTSIDKCTDETLSTFYHEYIHFLQDTYTLYGLRNINYMVNVNYQIAEEIRNKKDVKFPIKLKDENIKILNQLFIIYNGTSTLSEDPFDLININITPNNEIKNYETIEEVDINVLNFKGEKDSFYLGASVIRESMAYLIEHSIFGKSNVPIFPYKIVDFIIDRKYNDLNLSPEFRISLCEESLNSSHPGRTFFELLDRIKNRKISNYLPSSLHEFCHLNYFLMDENNVKSCIPLALETETKMAKENLKLYFNEDEDDRIKISIWLNFIFNKIKELRKNNFHFHKFVNNKELIISTINSLGTPLVGNKYNYYFMNPEIDQSECNIDLFLAIKELMLITINGQFSCGLKNYCMVNNPKLVNSKCDNNPLKNKNCSLDIVMKLWGLN